MLTALRPVHVHDPRCSDTLNPPLRKKAPIPVSRPPPASPTSSPARPGRAPPSAPARSSTPRPASQTGELDLASADLVGEVVTTAKDGLGVGLGATPRWPSAPRCCSSSASCSTSARRTSRALITAEHGKVLSDALGEVTRGLEVAEFACGIPHLLKGGFTENASTKVDVYSIRQSLGVVAVISPVQLPGHGADVVRADRDRLRQRRRHQAQREGPLGRQRRRGAVEGGRPARRRAQRRATATRRPSTRCSPTPTSRRSRSSGPPRSRSTSTRPAPRTASGCRPSAARRTTCSCCPTPTSTSPPTPRSTRASAPRVSGAWRSRRCVAVEPVADELVEKIKDRMGKLVTGDGTRGCDMGPLVTDAAPRQGDRRYLDAGTEAGRDARRRRPRGRRSTPTARATSSAPRCSTTSPRTCRSTRTRSSARCCRWCG